MLGDDGEVKLRVQTSTFNLKTIRVISAWAPIFIASTEKYRPNYPAILDSSTLIEEVKGEFQFV